jgi:hypothetical protein
MDPLEQLFIAIKNKDDVRANEIITAEPSIALKADSGGRTALHYAAGAGRDKVVSKLLEVGAYPNILNTVECTPLHYAAQNGHVEAVKILLDKGADRTIVDKYGQTPSALAVQEDLIEVFNSEQEIRRPSIPAAMTEEETSDVPASPPQDKEKIQLCQYFRGTLWEMGANSLKLKSAPVFDLLYGDTLKSADRVRWIHLPANNVSPAGYSRGKSKLISSQREWVTVRSSNCN